MNHQHEFTPEGQEDLENWSDMITINVYPDAHDGEALATKANAVLENYKSHKGKVLRTSSIPRTSKQACGAFRRRGFLAGQTLLRWHLLASNWWTASDARSSIRIAFTVKKLATR